MAEMWRLAGLSIDTGDDGPQSPETPGSDKCDRPDDCDGRGQRLYLVELVAEYWGI